MEEESGRLLRERLPSEWAIHGYAPDYGIDGAVEIFEFTDDTHAYAETLGESFFFQLKSTQSCDISTVGVPARGNVEKAPYRPTDEIFEMDVVRYSFDDTDELVTIEAMGSGAVVVLFLVCLSDQRVFFVSLTDLVDKVLTPESPEWREQGSKAIYIPTMNEVLPDSPITQNLLRYYAIRPKLMALFTKIHFQWAEVGYGQAELEEAEWYSMVLHFHRGPAAIRRLGLPRLGPLGSLPRAARAYAGPTDRTRSVTRGARRMSGLLVPDGYGGPHVRGRDSGMGAPDSARLPELLPLTPAQIRRRGRNCEACGSSSQP